VPTAMRSLFMTCLSRAAVGWPFCKHCRLRA
jgi:hypothetical protein